ncbi:ead/Ea22-like family protein [Citrobacter sp. Cf098]|uniref:ead/Ea22-like family protein n=1 Tax=Citrobacter sp. Cf098 TaxID=2985060 RepID=UPI0025777C70|nr:ead/Ea22-like family protein [Citrobacter sp. Cf098]MDM3181994.1 ead/Ea22-like family protein [Citrobacter sp. Cf098]MDM3182362.1 ead/Ea22-like family protein [Citrobacter sp. Cf098]
MSNINKQALREAAGKAISEEGETWWNEEQLASDYGLALHRADANFIAAANPATVLALLDELEAKDRRITELKEALKQSVSGYKSCLRTGHERIIELGGDCDAPEMMIARNHDIQQAEKVLSAGIITKVGE